MIRSSRNVSCATRHLDPIAGRAAKRLGRSGRRHEPPAVYNCSACLPDALLGRQNRSRFRGSIVFKRNQVEEAITKVFEPASARPKSETRTRIKRLLETDRALGRNKRSADPERANFAFYSQEAPGRGVENWFSGYEAFALLVGLRLMQWGLPQGLVVSQLRRVRRELEESHARNPEPGPSGSFRYRADEAARQAGRSCGRQ